MRTPFVLANLVFDPVHEIVDLIFFEDVVFKGHLPKDLYGAYMRQGPNPVHKPPGLYHWFDGDGMIHGVRLADGAARYRNRWVRTKGLQAELREGRSLFGGMAEMRS